MCWFKQIDIYIRNSTNFFLYGNVSVAVSLSCLGDRGPEFETSYSSVTFKYVLK